MKKLVTIIGVCGLSLIGFGVQAANTDFEAAVAQGIGVQGEKGEKGGKHLSQEELSARIQKHLAERQAELQRATDKGHMDIAAALQKVITDLTNMQTALNNKDNAAFKAANEQRKADREALEQLRKTDKQAKKTHPAKS
ncbi:MAG: hypothetical protein WCO42_10020 [bacterium]